MKKSEKEKLKKAFNIPEPERKEFFVSLYNEKLKKNERKFNMPVFFGYASTVAFASLIIGLWGHFNETADFNNKFNNTEITSTTTTTAVQTVTTTQLTEKTSSASTEPPTTESTSESSNTDETFQYTTHAPIEMPDIPDFIPPATVTTLSTATQSATTSKITFTTKTASYPTTTKRTTTTIKTTTTVLTVSEPVPDFTVSFETTTEIPAVHATTTYYTAIPTMTPAITTASRELDAPVDDVTTTPSPSLAAKDYTVYPYDIYSKSDKTVDIRDFIENNDSNSATTVSDIEHMIDDSDYIVSGRIDQIIYTQINGRPYTQENITIYAVYKGKMLKSNDRISIYIKGGYMPIGEFEKLHNLSIDVPDDYSVYDSGGNKGVQNIGDTFMFFIKDGSYSMPTKAFQLTEYTDISVFRKNNDKYISLGNENLYFDIKKLLNL